MIENMIQRIEARTKQLEMWPASRGSLPPLRMSDKELPMNRIDEPTRAITGQCHYSGPTHFDGPFKDDHFEDEPDWNIGCPRPRHRTPQNREDDDVRHLVKVTPPYFDGN